MAKKSASKRPAEISWRALGVMMSALGWTQTKDGESTKFFDGGGGREDSALQVRQAVEGGLLRV